MKNTSDLLKAISAFNAGELVIYPAESVYGIGCRISATQQVENLRKIKTREDNKGFIIVTAKWDSVADLLDLEQIPDVSDYNTTFVFKASKNAPSLLCQGDTLAVRVSRHKTTQAICENVGPIVSTSANFKGKPPPRLAEDIDHNLKQKVAFILIDDNFHSKKPSRIIDYASGKIIR